MQVQVLPDAPVQSTVFYNFWVYAFGRETLEIGTASAYSKEWLPTRSMWRQFRVFFAWLVESTDAPRAGRLFLRCERYGLENWLAQGNTFVVGIGFHL